MKTKVVASPVKLAALERVLARATRGEGELSRHAQMRMALLASINEGHWTAGERLPTETELVETTGFSLGTVQRALRTLTEEGVIRRQQGSGSYVASTHHRIDDAAHCRFLGDDGRTVLPVFSHVLTRRRWHRAGPWTAHFKDPRAQLYRLDRELNVNAEFSVVSRFYFDGERFKALASRPVGALAGTNFKVLLSEETPMPPSGVTQTLQIVNAPSDIASHIGAATGDRVALLEIVRRAAGGHDDVLYFQQMYIPPVSRQLVTHPAM